MQAIFGWAMQVAAVSALAMLFEMLLPGGNIKRFGRVVLSLSVVIALLKPILTLVKGYA
jgi:stage III sporulation protein AF